MITLRYIFVIAIILSTIPYLSSHRAVAFPAVRVTPTCGPAIGFNMIIEGNGFGADTNVNWKLVNSESQIPLYGYFQTNSMGGFRDETFADDLREDSYKMYFGTDANNDNKFDAETPTTYANITIPCPAYQQQEIPQQMESTQRSSNVQSGSWSDKCEKVQYYLLNPCSEYVNPDGSLNPKGVKAKNCIIGGGLLGIIGSLKLPPSAVITMLETAAPAANCGGIVDFERLKAAADPTSFLKELGIIA